MRVVIEPPTWLGDTVMASGAIEKLVKALRPRELSFFGSKVSLEVLNKKKAIVNHKNFATVKAFPKSDLFVSFRRSYFSRLLAFKAKRSFFFGIYDGHMVEKYNAYVDTIIEALRLTPDPKLYAPILDFVPNRFERPAIGINPGASYGSAKRWYPEKFAEVCNRLCGDFDIVIFGGPGEEGMADDIVAQLRCKNYSNLCGKLTIKELCEHIGGLSAFITNDSGPMHIASAMGIPTVAIFGPTDFTETHPFGNNHMIVSKYLSCAPCKKRECPLRHHRCMKEIDADEVIEAFYTLRLR